MYIAINGWFLSRPETGSGQYTHRLVEALSHLGGAPRLALVAPEEMTIDGLTRVQLERVALPGALRGHPAKVWFEQVGFPRACRRLGVDLAHVPYWGGPLHSPVPLVMTIHDLIPLLLPEYRGGVLARLYTGLVATSARGATGVLTDSQASRADILRHLGISAGCVRTVYLAAGAEYTPHEDNDGNTEQATRKKYGLPQRYMLYLGGFDVRKNLDTLLRATSLVSKESDSSIPLVLAGRVPKQASPRFPDVREMMQRYGLSDEDVRLIGEVEEGNKPALYRQASCFVYPSRYEGFGLPPLEAMACGAPVVAAKATSLPEIVGKAGLLVAPNDARGMANAILAVLTQKGLAEDLKRKGLAQARRFSWQQTAQVTLDAYRRAMSGQPLSDEP